MTDDELDRVLRAADDSLQNDPARSLNVDSGLAEVKRRAVRHDQWHTAEVTFRAGRHFMRGEFTYDLTDPFAVGLYIENRPDRHVFWTLSRNLLAESMERPVGCGDIRLSVRHGVLTVSLCSPDGYARLTCPAQPIREFVKRIHTACEPCCSGGNERLRLTPWVCRRPGCTECTTSRAALNRWLSDNGLPGQEASHDEPR